MPDEQCPECFGQGSYFTEWSDAAEASAAADGIIVLFYPDPPDGTVEIQCTRCHGGRQRDVA